MVRTGLLAAMVAAFFSIVPAAYASHGPTQAITTANSTLSADFTGHILIGADNVTLDCNYHYILGPGANDAAGIGIDLTGRRNSKITRCHVGGFRYGILLSNSHSNVMIFNYLYRNKNGIKMLNSTGNIFYYNNSGENIGNGFDIKENTNNNTFIQNYVLWNNEDGFDLDQSY